MPKAARDDGTCLHGRIDVDAIIHEGWPIRFDASEGRNNASFRNCRQLQSCSFVGQERRKIFKIFTLCIKTPKHGKKR